MSNKKKYQNDKDAEAKRKREEEARQANPVPADWRTPKPEEPKKYVVDPDPAPVPPGVFPDPAPVPGPYIEDAERAERPLTVAPTDPDFVSQDDLGAVVEGVRLSAREGFRRETIELSEEHWNILNREAARQNVTVATLIYRTVARSLSNI